jgi:drug/metabolite transporter (DMT)-like permease
VALVALIFVTAIWGVTFVQVKDAVEIYPLFAFLAVRFAIASLALAPFAAGRIRTLDRRGLVAGGALGGLLALGYALQTAGLSRTTVSSTGFITGLCVVLTPVIAYVLFRDRIPGAAWFGVALATVGLAMLSGIDAGSAGGDALVLGGAAAYALQIVLLERYAPDYDPFAFTLVEMITACLGFTAIALARGELSVPHGWTVWGALLVTGIFASAFAFLVQTWAQRRLSATRTALAFSAEPVFAGLFGYLLAGDRLGALGWGGCVLILAGIVVSEPAAASSLKRSIRRSPGRPRRQARSARRSAGP